jgi:Zn-dependent M16 (insulinase) family peptidase
MVHADFNLKRTQAIESLGVEVQEFEHKKTGAMHYHLAADNEENVFLVALRTMPMDSTGVAHILEHTALCGSQNYPVRDPFFMMIRRSLNTFMNAFTSSDWTAYPFASKNKKDFNNLLSVYLDAVFFASLNEQDFAQEGHRLEFEDPKDSNSPLQFKGVVYNEMKGAMSSVSSQLWQAVTKHLYPTNTYHFNSGGDPEAILDLSYEELKSFYKKHYHPSNAIFMTYGDIPASEHHKAFAEYLDQFEKLEERITVQDEKRYFAPIKVEERYGFNQLDKQTHHTMAWLLGHSANLDEQLEAHFLSSLLLENSSSPLRLALETTDLATGPSPLCGLEDSNKEMCFLCGVEGSESENRDDVEALILSTLENIVKDGISQQQIDSVLHQLELSQREVGGDGYPYGLQIILSAISACSHYSDPVELLNLDPALDKLREKAQLPDFIETLINKYLLNNPHRVTLTFSPDDQLDQRKAEAEKQKLEDIKKALSESQIKEIVNQGTALQERQLTKDDESILPKVTLEDVAEKLLIPVGKAGELPKKQKVTTYTQGTNGLTYHQVLLALPQLNEEELLLLPLVTAYISELGVNGESYLETQQRQSLVVGGISAFSSIRASLTNLQETQAYWVVSGKALSRNHDEFVSLMHDTLYKVDFTDSARIKDLIAQSSSRKEQAITSNGHGLAMNIAASGMSPIAQLSYRSSGLPSLLRIRQQHEDCNTPDKLEALCAKLEKLHKKIIATQAEHLLVSDSTHIDSAVKSLGQNWQESNSVIIPDFKMEKVDSQIKEAWIIPSQTNFCAKAYKTVGADHEDSPALAVLGGFLRNGFLHTAIREQGGAYGGGASQDSSTGAFKFYSYRDPRFKGTFEDFDRAIDWFKAEDKGYEQLEQAILGVISGIDKPNSPAGEAKQAFHNERQGRTEIWRNAFRQKVLSLTYSDLDRAVEKYLLPKNASMGALIQKDNKEQAIELGMNIKEI